MLDSGGTDNDNVREYETITREMKSVANFFGKTALSRLDEDEFLAYIGDARKKCGDRAVLRAWHFFNEDKRAIRCAELLNKNDFQKFLREVDNSGKSSFMYLQNVLIRLTSIISRCQSYSLIAGEYLTERVRSECTAEDSEVRFRLMYLMIW